MRICDKLGKFPHEVEALPCDEFDRILTFYIFEAEEQKKLNKKANKNSVDPNKYINR